VLEGSCVSEEAGACGLATFSVPAEALVPDEAREGSAGRGVELLSVGTLLPMLPTSSMLVGVGAGWTKWLAVAIHMLSESRDGEVGIQLELPIGTWTGSTWLSLAAFGSSDGSSVGGGGGFLGGANDQRT
jgi:hypothetical protein